MAWAFLAKGEQIDAPRLSKKSACAPILQRWWNKVTREYAVSIVDDAYKSYAEKDNRLYSIYDRI